MRAQFVLSEVGIGLWRNVTMTVSAILTVAVSLAVLGVGVAFGAQANETRAFWYDEIELSVFLNQDVTGPQRDSVRSTLEGMPEVEQIIYESKQDAYVRFQEQFQDSPDLLDNVDVKALPESFRVRLQDPQESAVIADRVDALPGVDSVIDVDRLLGGFFNIVNKVRWGAILIAGLLVVVALLMIYNTVRVAAFSRRRETGIMRLVGASNLYIRLPFMLEGAVAGLIGSAIACGLLAAFYYFVVVQALRPALSRLTTFIGWDTIGLIGAGILVFGVVLSALASLVTLQRHLKV